MCAPSRWPPAPARNGLSRAAPVLLLLLSVSCFEPPVTETVEIRFLAPEGVGITVSIRLAFVDGRAESNGPLADRMEETRRALLEGRDDWSRRLERLAPALERGAWERQEGKLTRWVRSAAFEDPADLAAFFADTAVHPRVVSGEGWQELSLTTTRPIRATREQARAVDEALGRWSETLARYFAAGARLHDHLARRPDRARACYGAILGAYVSEETKETIPEPDDVEQTLLEPLQEAMKEALEVLEVAEGEAYSLDELSRVVFDPFPATVVVRVPGSVVEVEGFKAGEEGRLVAPAISLWSALRALEGRFVTPDPMLAIVAHSRSRKEEPLDLDAFLARPRRESPAPTAIQVGEAIREGLAPAPIYRVRWSTAGLAEKDDVEEWLTGERPEGR